ncbi:MAG: SUMF1/EgtB/PvdO family nonheme iron enzyme [Nitrospirota bacterium]
MYLPRTWALVSLLLLAGLSPMASQAGVPSLQQPDAYAVVIGISQYREEVIPKVAYGVKDAEAVAKLLETQAGIPKSHIRVMTDAKATSADLRTIGDWLRMRVKPESTVYVYYAGHGTPDPKTGDAYLVPWDGHPDYPDGLYPLKALYESLNKLPAKQVLVLLDSCFSGSAGRSLLAKGARPMVLSLENPLLAAGKVVVLAASTGTQISSDYDKAGHGLFTYALLTGLHGEADQDKDGLVTLKELYPYVRKQVAETAVEELNREQTPVLLPGEEVLGARSALPVTVARARPYEALRQPGRELTGKDGAKMLLIPAGEFLMGSTEGEADEQPVHRVTLDAFYLDKYEVTNRLFQKFVRETGYETTAEKEGKAWAYVHDDKWTEVSGANWRKPEGGETVFVSNRDEHPVVSVSWYDAEAYCRWAGKRLPTEAEFEYANRGGTQTTYWWGDGNPGSRRVANIADRTNKQRFPGRPWPIMDGYDDGYGRTAPVGSFDPNPFGLHDTTGNVWEWTADWYGKDYYERSSQRNPTGPSNGKSRVLRGGSWYDEPVIVRSALRFWIQPANRNDVIGFRCVQDVPK